MVVKLIVFGLFNIVNGISLCPTPPNEMLNDWATSIVDSSRYISRGSRKPATLKNLLQLSSNHDHLVSVLSQAVDTFGSLCHTHNHNIYPAWDYQNRDNLKRQILEFIYGNINSMFDHDGLQQSVNYINEIENTSRFTQSLSELGANVPHCDHLADDVTQRTTAVAGSVKFPGGSFRLDAGFDLSKWLSTMLMEQTSNMSTSANPIASVITMTASSAVLSLIQTVVGAVIDIVPPMIPPPFWILWSLPCLPLLTSSHCLFSVLYPVSLTEFISGSTTDSILDGIFQSFPAVYSAKVGKTSDSQYMTCAAAYLGMHCASKFPMCWIPMGVREAMSMPMCFMHCLLTLVACPGFWVDDVVGPCMNISVPPLCSFSIFVAMNKIPPQYTSYNDGHPYPTDCGSYEIVAVDDSLPELDITKLLNESHETFTSGESAISKLSDYAGVQEEMIVDCDCTKPCYLHDVEVLPLPCQCTSVCADYQSELRSHRAESVDQGIRELLRNVNRDGSFIDRLRERSRRKPRISSNPIGHVLTA